MLFINGSGNQTFESFYLKHFNSLEDLQNCTECFKNLSIYSESIYYQVSSSTTSSFYRLLKEGDYWLDENYWRNGGNNFTSSYTLGNLTTASLNIITSGSTRIYVSASGQVGINTILPSEILSVSGNIDYTGRLKISGSSGSTGQFLKVSGSTNIWASMSINDISDFGTYTSSLSASVNALNLFSSSVNTWSGSISSSLNGLNLHSSSVKTWSSSINSHTSSINTWSGSISSSLNGLNLFSASIKSYTSSMNSWSGGVDTNLANINTFSASIKNYTSSILNYTSSMNTWSGSVSSSLNGLNLYTQSNNNVINNFSTYTSSIKNYTSSINIWSGSIETWSGSVSSSLNGLNLHSSSVKTWSSSINSHTSSILSYTSSMNTWSGSILSYTSSMNTATSSFFRQNGNSFGANAVLGTDDNYSLSFETNNLSRLYISSSGLIGMGGNINPQATVHIGDSIAPITVRLSSPSTGSSIISLVGARQYDLISDAGGIGTPIVGAAGFAIRDVSSGLNRLTIDSAGSISIGTTASPSSYNLRVSKAITGATSAFGIVSDGTIQSDVTNIAIYNRVIINTQATTFGVSEVMAFGAYANAVGAGSTITSSYGFYVPSSFTVATNNYGYMGLMPSGSGNRWNLFMAGSAPNYLAGKLLIGTTAAGNRLVSLSSPATGSGAIVYGLLNNSAIGSDVSTAMRYFNTISATFTNAGTIPDVIHYMAEQGTIGVSSSITTQTGFYAANSIVGASTNYGFRGNIPNGSNNWNLYIDGTAPNYLNATLALGTITPHASASLDITSTTKVFLPPRMTTTQRDAIAVTPTGSIIFNTTTLKHQGYTGTAWSDFY